MDTLLSFDTYLTLLINGSDSVWLDSFAMLCTKTWVWIPLYLAILIQLATSIKRPTLWYILGAIVLSVVLCDQVSSSIVKPLVGRPRPTHDPAIMYIVDTVNNYRGGQYGFFSSHAANTMCIALFVSMIIRQRYTTMSLLLWSLLNCWTRLYLGVHFVGDVLVGLLFGGLVGFATFKMVGHIVKSLNTDFPPSTSYVIPASFLATPILAAIFSIFL